MSQTKTEKDETQKEIEATVKNSIETAMATKLYYLAYQKVGFSKFKAFMLTLVYNYALAVVRSAPQPMIVIDQGNVKSGSINNMVN